MPFLEVKIFEHFRSNRRSGERLGDGFKIKIY